MQPVSIQDARLNRINIEVKSSIVKKPGTLITKRNNIVNNKIITEYHQQIMMQHFNRR